MKSFMEVDFPIKEVSEESAREKNIRHGHISTLHIWWARRPLASSRASIYAALTPEPKDEEERLKRAQFITNLSKWENSLNKDLIDRARKEILEANGGVPPKVLDPFAGGGAIPLEALRLGCETYASDLNPIAVLIEKCTLEYPQKFRGQGSEVRELGSGVRSQGTGKRYRLATEKDLEIFKEAEKYLEKKRQEMIDRGQKAISNKNNLTPDPYSLFATLDPVPDEPLPPKETLGFRVQRYGIWKWGDLFNSRQKLALITFVEKVRQAYVGIRSQGSGSREKGEDKDGIISGTGSMEKAHKFGSASLQDNENFSERRDICPNFTDPKGSNINPSEHSGRVGSRDDEGIYPISEDSERVTDGTGDTFNNIQRGRIFEGGKFENSANPNSGTGENAQRFNQEPSEEKHSLSPDPRSLIPDDEYAKAVVSYLAISVNNTAEKNNSISKWANTKETIAGSFGRQELPMVWDYFESNPFSGSTGDWLNSVYYNLNVIKHCSLTPDPQSLIPKNTQSSATSLFYPDDYFDEEEE